MTTPSQIDLLEGFSTPQVTPQVCNPWREAVWRMDVLGDPEHPLRDDSGFLRQGWALGRWGIVAPRSGFGWCWQLEETVSGKRAGRWPCGDDPEQDLRDFMAFVERLHAATRRWHLLPLVECGPEFFEVYRQFRAEIDR